MASDSGAYGSNPPRLTGERVYMESMTERDIPFLYELLSDRTTTELLGCEYHRSPLETERFLQYIREMNELSARIDYGIYFEEALIGIAGLKRDGESSFSFGIALRKAFRGRGFGKEAAELLVTAAFDVFGAAELKAMCIEGNSASCAMLASVGFNKAESNINGRLAFGLSTEQYKNLYKEK